MSDRILLVLPLNAFIVNGRVFLDDQACAGLDHWLSNFDFATLACPATRRTVAPSNTLPIDSIKAANRLRFVGLPMAYTPLAFIKTVAQTSRTLAALMDEVDYLHFAIGGFWGDWGSLASVIASRKKLPFAVWTDRVESRVIMFQSKSRKGVARFYAAMSAILASRLEKYVIKQSSLGLFHGMDTYQAYAKLSNRPYLVHDVNFKDGSHISEPQLAARLSSSPDRTFRFAYAGRVHRDKGIHDWIDTFATTREQANNFEATWYGDGPELEPARVRIQQMKLDGKIQFPGPLNDHKQMMSILKQYDAFVFCHKTPESPRCLIEALVCGLPIIGYSSAYAANLIQKNGGGILTPANHPEALSEVLLAILQDRTRLNSLSIAAAKDGCEFSAVSVFRHRSDLMKLIPVRRSSAAQVVSS